MTGAYLRIKRNNKIENIEIEFLTDEEREQLLKDDTRLMQWLHIVCNKLNEVNTFLEELERDGILEKVWRK